MFRRVSTDWKSLEFPTGPVYPTEVSTSIYWNQLLFLFGMCLTWNRLQNVCNFLFLFAQTSLTSCSSESFLCSRRNCRTKRRCSRSSRRTATCCLMSSAVRMRTRTSWSWTTASWPPASQEELFIKTEELNSSRPRPCFNVIGCVKRMDLLPVYAGLKWEADWVLTGSGFYFEGPDGLMFLYQMFDNPNPV